MKLYYDLHIHSVLSACGDTLSTPNNLLNMCMLKGLDVISITDHNSALQYEAIEEIKDSYDFLIIYGIEVTVNEGFHVLTYFEKKEEALALSKIIDASINHDVLTPLPQTVTDVYDLDLYQIPYFLNQPTAFSFQKLITIVRNLNGLIIPAHINRSHGILGVYKNLHDFDIDGIEISKDLDMPKDIDIDGFKVIYDSDAHSIESINEKDNSFSLKEKSFNGFKEWLKERI